MTVKKLFQSALIAGGSLAMMAGGQAAAQTKLTLVHPFPTFLVYTKSCLELVAKINKAGKGVVQIDVRGGPEAIKMFQQAPAVSKGAVDMTCIPAAFYANAIPENEAIATSNASPAAVRANGGMAIIDRLHQRYFKVKYLGWIDSGPGFHVYMAETPKFRKDGLPDFSTTKMRDNPIYGAFFRALDAKTHNMAATQVYAALEKGIINAAAWTSIGLQQLKWDKFLRNRLDPKFYQTDMGVLINLRKWRSMSAKARKIVQDTVIEHEQTSRAARMKDIIDEEDALRRGGMKFFTVPAQAKYIEIGISSAYNRMFDRLKKRKRSLQFARQLRKLYRVGE